MVRIQIMSNACELQAWTTNVNVEHIRLLYEAQFKRLLSYHVNEMRWQPKFSDFNVRMVKHYVGEKEAEI